MKKILSIFLLCCSMLFILRAEAEQTLDQIMAVINDDVITRSELDSALNRIKMQISQEHISAPTGAALQKQVLDQLINKKLQLQTARQLGIDIPDSAVNQAIESVAKQNNTTIADLYQRLTEEHLSVAEYRQEIREQMTVQKLQQQEIGGKMHITPEEVSLFLRSRSWQMNGEKEYRIEDILIPLTDEPSSDEIVQAKKQAIDVIAKLRSGKSFSALAGSDLGWRKLPEIPSAFAEQVTHMQANEIAGPIQTSNGLHVIRLTRMRLLGNKQAKPNRKQVEELLLQQKYEEAIQSWVSKLRGQAYIVMNKDKHERS